MTAQVKHFDALTLYTQVRVDNPAPYGAFMHLNLTDTEDFVMLSSSPERFMRVDQNGAVSMKPIKGTIKRHLDEEQDAIARQ